jgi:Flp pilus assembly protein CpaB
MRTLPRFPLALALRRRPRLRRGLALGAAALVGLVVQRTAASAEATRAAWGERREVAVAARDLAPGHVLRAQDLRAVELPAAALPPDPLGVGSVGRTVRSAVYEGEVLTQPHVGRDGAAGVAALLPEGDRAVAVPLSDVGAPPLRVGQRVDLLAVVATGEGSGPQAGPLVRAAPVLHVDRQAATVAVDEADAPRVAAALALGAITVVVAP